MKNFIVKSDRDNVGNALENIAPGDDVAWSHGECRGQIKAASAVPFGFKMALVDLPRGSEIRSYGTVIGVATQDIRAGECVHVHNMAGRRGNTESSGGKA